MLEVYKKQIRIPFHLSDPAGILFFGNIFSLAHEVYESWITHKLHGWEKWFENKEWVAPIKSTQADYFKPLKAGDSFEVILTLKKVGQSSFVLVTEFKKNGFCHARIETVQVFCLKSTFEKIPIPPLAQKLFQ